MNISYKGESFLGVICDQMIFLKRGDLISRWPIYALTLILTEWEINKWHLKTIIIPQ